MFWAGESPKKKENYNRNGIIFLFVSVCLWLIIVSYNICYCDAGHAGTRIFRFHMSYVMFHPSERRAFDLIRRLNPLNSTHVHALTWMSGSRDTVSRIIVKIHATRCHLPLRPDCNNHFFPFFQVRADASAFRFRMFTLSLWSRNR